jgi:hypothetical protein
MRTDTLGALPTLIGDKVSYVSMVVNDKDLIM